MKQISALKNTRHLFSPYEKTVKIENLMGKVIIFPCRPFFMEDNTCCSILHSVAKFRRHPLILSRFFPEVLRFVKALGFMNVVCREIDARDPGVGNNKNRLILVWFSLC